MSRRFIPEDNRNYTRGQQTRLRQFTGVRTTRQLINQARNAGIDLGVRPDTQQRRAFQYAAGLYNTDIETRRAERERQRNINRRNAGIRRHVTQLNQNTLREFLRDNIGRRVGLRYIDNGNTIRNPTYNIPNAEGFDKWYRTTILYGWYYPEEDNPFTEFPNGQLYGFTPRRGLTDERIIQAFADGITNCLLTPILDWGIGQEADAKTSRTARRYKKFVKDTLMLLNKYPNAVPEEDLQYICDLLQIKIEVEFAMPNSVPFLSIESNKKFLRTFKFINTRINHVELNTVVSDNQEVSTREYMNELLETEDVIYYNKNNTGIISVNTINAKYVLEDDYRDVVNKFEKDTGLVKCKIDAVTEPELSDFVRSGTHFNGTVDYELIHEETDDGFEYVLDETGIKHIDMEKAYIQFRESKYYTGFMGKVHHFRVTDKVQGIGLWVIDDLDYSGVCDNTRAHLEALNIYCSGQIYTNGDLDFLTDVGATYKVTAGAWSVEPIHFTFTDEMINGVFVAGTEKTKYYCKWVGCCHSAEPDKMIFTKGDDRFCKVLRQGGIDATCYDNKEICMVYPKKSVRHLSQVASYITAYTRLNVLEQLIKFDADQIVRVCVDGIYYRPRKFNRLCPDVEMLIDDFVGPDLSNTFRPKFEMTFKNHETGQYTCGWYDGIFKGSSVYRDGKYSTEAHTGVGGGGKTHNNLVDTGLQRVLYVSPSWKLARSKKEEYNCDVSVLARIVDDPERMGMVERNYNVLIVDECSMITEGAKLAILNRYRWLLVIFCGDLGYQLPPTTNKEMTLTHIQRVVTYTENRRCQCDKLREILNTMRFMMKNKKSNYSILSYVYGKFTQQTSVNYNINDMILATEHRYKDEWTAKYSKRETLDLEIKKLKKKNKLDKREGLRLSIFTRATGGNVGDKWFVKSNNSEYSNGQIVIGKKPEGVPSDLQHAFTVHSIQGETAQNQLIIDKRGIHEARMLYTALSRAKYYSQIKIF